MIEEKEIQYPGVGQSWGIVGIAILAAIVFCPVIPMLKSFLGKEVAFLFYYILAMGTTLVIAHTIRKKRTGIDKYNFSLSSAKIMVLVSVAAIALQIGIITPIVDQIPMPDSMKKVFQDLANQNGPFAFITMVIAAPIFEELIFRGIILDGLLRRYSPLKSIILSSVLFGILHLNPWQFVTAMGIGIFSGWVYYKTGKLSLCVLIHLTNNLFAFIGMYFMDSDKCMDESLVEMYGGYQNLVLSVAGAITILFVCISLLRKEFKSRAIDQWHYSTKDIVHLPGDTISDGDVN